MEREGRQRYYRLASAKVAAALEGLALLVEIIAFFRQRLASPQVAPKRGAHPLE
jgi:hypothetical protein